MYAIAELNTPGKLLARTTIEAPPRAESKGGRLLSSRLLAKYTGFTTVRESLKICLLLSYWDFERDDDPTHLH